MAFNLTVEDSSPLITYAPSGAWTDSPDGDSLLQSYSDGSLHTTSAQGATATIQFNGTGIWLFGGKRSNYGTYSISVDGTTISESSANSGDNQTDQLLGSAQGLSNGEHTVVLTNTGSGQGVDLDLFVFQGAVGANGATVSNTTMDDTDPSIIYVPSSASWSMNSAPNLNYNSSLHYSQTQGASATFPFTGNAVAVYGTVSPDHADLQVVLDGKTKTFAGGGNGFARVLHTKTLLYYADNLGGSGQQHQLVLSAAPSASAGQFIDIDAVTVYTSSGGSSSSDPSNPSSDHAGAHSSKPDLVVILGATLGGVVALVLLGILAFFLLRRRRQTNRRFSMPPPLTPALPIQQADMEAGFGRPFSNYFREVKLSPSGPKYPSGPPQIISTAFRSDIPYRNSGHSYQSFESTEAMLTKPWPIPPSMVQLPTPPQASVSRLTPSAYPDLDSGMRVGPGRPVRPPSLKFGDRPWEAR